MIQNLIFHKEYVFRKNYKLKTWTQGFLLQFCSNFILLRTLFLISEKSSNYDKPKFWKKTDPLQVYHVYPIYLIKISIKAKDIYNTIFLHCMNNGAITVIYAVIILFP